MYRARVDAVNGCKVRAGGKWLTCIGNRAVKVGDRIWTDGRCVYGNDREGTAPIVIANPTKDDLAIPIALNKDLYTYHKSLGEVRSTLDTSAVSLTNDRKGHTYLANDSKILASNSDNQGNVYYMRKNGNKIDIIKNDEIMKTVDIPQEAREETEHLLSDQRATYTGLPDRMTIIKERDVIASGSAPMKYDDGVEAFELEWWHRYFTSATITYRDYTPITIVSEWNLTSSNECDWAFIENEFNWAAVITEKASGHGLFPYTIAVALIWNSPFDAGTLQQDVIAYDCTHYRTKTYFISDSNCHSLFNSFRGMVHRFEGGGIRGSWAQYIGAWTGLASQTTQYYETSVVVAPSVYNPDNFVNTKFPMQDGFFFVVNSVSPEIQTYPNVMQNMTFPPSAMNITIYAKNEEPIFTGDFLAVSYISVCKIGYRKFLLAVTNPLGRSKAYNEGTVEVIRQGLYLIKDGILTQIKDGKIINQCLRPMKNYKNWWERIRTIE